MQPCHWETGKTQIGEEAKPEELPEEMPDFLRSTEKALVSLGISAPFLLRAEGAFLLLAFK